MCYTDNLSQIILIITIGSTCSSGRDRRSDKISLYS